MPVSETDLPGVGKRFDVDLDDERQLSIVIHNTGKRELYLREGADEDATRLFELTDQLARVVGTILEGAYFQPVRSGSVEAVLEDDSLIEWVSIDEESPLVDVTLETADVRGETGVSIIAIQREGRTIASPGPKTTLRADDTLVTIGSREDHERLEALVSGDG